MDSISLVIAFVSLLVAAWVAWITTQQWQSAKRHAELSVRPAVNIRYQWGDEREFSGLTLSNDGLGTALVRTLEVSIDGERLESPNPWPEVARRLDFRLDDFVWEWFDDEEWAPGYTLFTFGIIRRDYCETRRAELSAILQRVHIEVQALDLYGNEVRTAVFHGPREVETDSQSG